MTVQIKKTSSGYSVNIPKSFNSLFQESFPSASFDSESSTWTVGKKYHEKLVQFVEALSLAIGVAFSTEKVIGVKNLGADGSLYTKDQLKYLKLRAAAIISGEAKIANRILLEMSGFKSLLGGYVKDLAEKENTKAPKLLKKVRKAKI